MQVLKIAIRNLRRQKKRTVLLGGAIGFGIMVITLINGFTAGASVNLKDNFSYLLAGHVYVSEQTRRDDDRVISEFRNIDILDEVLSDLGLDGKNTVRRSSAFGTLLFSGRTSEQNIDGINWAEESGLQDRLVLLSGSIQDVVNDPDAIVLNEQSARRLGVEVGETILLRSSTVSGQQNVISLRVAGIMQDPGILGSISSYAHRSTVNNLINISPESYQAVHINLPRIEDTERVTDLLYKALSDRAAVAERAENASGLGLDGPMFVHQDRPEQSWSGQRFVLQNINDFTNEIDQLALALNATGTGILLVLIVITMIGVVNTFRMIMFERVREIGTMRAIGVQRKSIRRIFLYEAACLAAVGYLCGLIMAIVISFGLGFIAIPLENPFALFTAQGQLSFPLQSGSLIANFILITILTVLAAALPARKAARLLPADALRSVA
ncbi:ABC transporter permease [Spirochaeta dissipatitropha]